jgi:phage repressor protein C with HTH and peptisase S24 domain
MDKVQQLIAQWVRSARKDAGLSQADLGTKLALELGEERGHTKANISHWETQKHSPNLRQLMAIAKITGQSLPQQLLPGDAGKTPDTSVEHGEDEKHPFIESAVRVRMGDEPDTIPIRRVKLRLRAGVAGYETEPELDDGGVLHVPRAIIEENNLVPHKLLAIRVRGCSMEPMMFEDDLVVVNTADTRPISREVYAVNFSGEACVKQLLLKGGQWYLHSLNPEFSPVNIRSGQCDIVGRVVYQPGRLVTGRL